MLSTTTHDAPAPALSRADAWEDGVSFQAFLPSAQKNVDLWTQTYERADPPADLLSRVASIPGDWRLLVLSADWCGDASNTVPFLARLAEAAPTLDLRLLDRDDHLALMDEHLTNGTSRSIPAVILLDGEGVERAWWGPRPADLQNWVLTVGKTLEPDVRYREIRKWYARDKGRTTLEEVVAMIERASGARVVA